MGPEHCKNNLLHKAHHDFCIISRKSNGLRPLRHRVDVHRYVFVTIGVREGSYEVKLLCIEISISRMPWSGISCLLLIVLVLWHLSHFFMNPFTSLNNLGCRNLIVVPLKQLYQLHDAHHRLIHGSHVGSLASPSVAHAFSPTNLYTAWENKSHPCDNSIGHFNFVLYFCVSRPWLSPFSLPRLHAQSVSCSRSFIWKI